MKGSLAHKTALAAVAVAALVVSTCALYSPVMELITSVRFRYSGEAQKWAMAGDVKSPYAAQEIADWLLDRVANGSSDQSRVAEDLLATRNVSSAIPLLMKRFKGGRLQESENLKMLASSALDHSCDIVHALLHDDSIGEEDLITWPFEEGSDRCYMILKNAMTSGDDLVRVKAAKLMAGFKPLPPYYCDVIQTTLKDANVRVSVEGLQAIIKMRSAAQPALANVLQLLQAEHFPYKQLCVTAITCIGVLTPEIESILLDLVNGSDGYVALDSCNALLKMGAAFDVCITRIAAMIGGMEDEMLMRDAISYALYTGLQDDFVTHNILAAIQMAHCVSLLPIPNCDLDKRGDGPAIRP
jgi:hypothetical protein